MEFEQIIANAMDFFQGHQLISFVALAVLVFFFYQSPKETFKSLVVLAILAIVGYFILQMGSSADIGVSSKEELTRKTKKALGD